MTDQQISDRTAALHDWFAHVLGGVAERNPHELWLRTEQGAFVRFETHFVHGQGRVILQCQRGWGLSERHVVWINVGHSVVPLDDLKAAILDVTRRTLEARQ